MIISNIKNNSFEEMILSPVIKEAIDYIKNTDFSIMAKGKYPIKGDKIFAIVDEYETIEKQDKKTEAHRKYIDIQFIFSGKEKMGFAFENPENKMSEEYNENKDVIHFSKVENELDIPACPGMFFIFFPEEVHRPGCVLGQKEKIKKIIVKISKDLI